MRIFTLEILCSGAGLVSRVAAVCAADNCYNQLSRRPADASPFCAGFTTTAVTDVGSFPTYVSTSCGTSRVSSACSCLWPAAATTTAAPPAGSCSIVSTETATSTVTVTTTPSPTNLVANGAIPGLAPWYNGDIINESSYNYNAPQIALSPGSPTGGAL